MSGDKRHCKSPKTLEIRVFGHRGFGQKERTATLIPIVSKLWFLFGGAEERLCEQGPDEPPGFAWLSFGGLEGDRTLDLCVANAALSQLSYEPVPMALPHYNRKKRFVKGEARKFS